MRINEKSNNYIRLFIARVSDIWFKAHSVTFRKNARSVIGFMHGWTGHLEQEDFSPWAAALMVHLGCFYKQMGL